MKQYLTLFSTLTIICSTVRAEKPDFYQDSYSPYISKEQPIEELLIDAFIALPQDYFEYSLRQRVLAMHNHKASPSIRLNSKTKSVHLQGDGGQGSITMTVLGWPNGFLKVKFVYEFESEVSTEVLTRTKYGWSIEAENRLGEQDAAPNL